MFDKDKWQEIFGSIKRNPLRSLLTALSVTWGIFVLIILSAAGIALRNGAEDQFKSDAVNAIWIEGGQTSLPYKGMKPGRTIQFTNEDYELIKSRIDGVDKITSSYDSRGIKTISYKNQHAAYMVRSCLPDHNYLENAKTIEGRFINKNDIDDFRKVCAIGAPVKETFFKNEDPIGKYLDVQGIPYKVVGVFTDPGRGDIDRIYIPLSTAQKAYNGKKDVHVIWLSTGDAPIEKGNQMVEEIKKLMASKYSFDVNDPRATQINNNKEEYVKIMSTLHYIDLFVKIIGLLTLLAGIIGVSNIMIVVVKERTKEIGVRKAIGATPGSIVSMIILESIFITSIAGYIGLFAAAGVVGFVNWIAPEGMGEFFKHPEIDMNAALLAIFTLILSGIVAGIIPALRAANIQPITALRDA